MLIQRDFGNRGEGRGDISDEPRKARPRKRIYMWEMMEKSGETFFIPLDENFAPLGDIALVDVSAGGNGDLSRWQNFVLVSGILGSSPKSGPDGEILEEYAVQTIEKVLRGGDATTRQIYEALVLELLSSDLGDGPFRLDVERLLYTNFWYYEFPLSTGVMARKWTLEERLVGSYREPHLIAQADIGPWLQCHLN